MRPFIKKLFGTTQGSQRLLTERETQDLKEFVASRQHRIVTNGSAAFAEENTAEDAADHQILFALTEQDAVKLVKSLKPETVNRKSPRQVEVKKDPNDNPRRDLTIDVPRVRPKKVVHVPLRPRT